jgi:hypothetical protein
MIPRGTPLILVVVDDLSPEVDIHYLTINSSVHSDS